MTTPTFHLFICFIVIPLIAWQELGCEVSFEMDNMVLRFFSIEGIGDSIYISYMASMEIYLGVNATTPAQYSRSWG